ncbi:hypothetical protein Tco_1201641 [Tanacetum coccineum]
MLLAGSELTKEERETQLYDEFERFKMLPGENINEYYVQFHKLINDMRNIKMTMPNIQLNSKFMNNMSLKWDRNRGAQNRVGNANAGQDVADASLREWCSNGSGRAALSGWPANLQAGPSNASILSEVHDLENIIDHCDDNQDEPETHNEVQQKHVIDSNGADMGNSNVIPYEQYLTINEVSVEPSCASFVSNDVYVLHDNNAYIPHPFSH